MELSLNDLPIWALSQEEKNELAQNGQEIHENNEKIEKTPRGKWKINSPTLLENSPEEINSFDHSLSSSIINSLSSSDEKLQTMFEEERLSTLMQQDCSIRTTVSPRWTPSPIKRRRKPKNVL